jgi:hypothetical protein
MPEQFDMNGRLVGQWPALPEYCRIHNPTPNSATPWLYAISRVPARTAVIGRRPAILDP